MSTNALNQVYKTGLLKIEEAVVLSNVVQSDLKVKISGVYMTGTPFVVGQSYIIYDRSWSGDIPNAERIKVTALKDQSDSGSALTAAARSDGIGYNVTGYIYVVGWGPTGWNSTGVVNAAYTTVNSAAILTPGVEMAITNADMNCRFKTIVDAPKIDFDDESSRFATGDEGRDISIAGARSGEITFTQKLAWGGTTSAIPVWEKLLRSMGHWVRGYTSAISGGVPLQPSGYDDIEDLITSETLNPGNEFYTNDGSDTTDDYLAGVKGSVLTTGDTFIVNAGVKFLGIATATNTGISIAGLITAKSLAAGDKLYTLDGTDTSDAAFTAAKALKTSVALTVGDTFIVNDDLESVIYDPPTVILASAGTEFFAHTWANEITATIWIITPENGASPVSTVYRYRGAHGGNGSSLGAGKIGDPYMLTAKYNAAYVSTMEIPFTYARVLTSPETSKPEVLINNTITVPAYISGSPTTKSIEISQFSLDFGGVVNPFIDQSASTGNFYFATQDRDPRFTCNPYMVRKNLDDIDTELTNMLSGKVILKSAATNPHITIEMPNAQQLNPAIASREGYVNTNRTYRPLRNDIGAGAIDTDMPDSVMYSILVGGRS